MTILATIAAIGAALSAFFFRKGGTYNPEPVAPRETPVKPPISTSSAPKLLPQPPQQFPTLSELCTAMRDFEGKPGDPNYRNNNPLNCRYFDGGYLAKYLPVKKSPDGFAIFKDYQTGWLYGFEMQKAKIENHPTWTLLDLVTSHAPASDNNPTLAYATNVAKRLGVDIHFPLKNLVLV